MSQQKEVRPQPRKEDKKEAEEVKPNPVIIEKWKEVKKDINDLLEKIDGVLQENSEEFVKNYIQKGGE